MMRIEVADTGRGIDERAIPKLFTPFERLGATDTDGSGLGLALSKAMLHSAAAPGGYSIDVLLDNLLSPDVHAEIDRDLRSAFGPEGDDVYHAILLQALLDMKRANRL